MLATRPLAASRFPTPLVNPATYASPSGEYQLHIEPSERQGAGPGVYTLTRDGAVEWSWQRGVTIRDAIVTDGGVIVGNALTKGVTHYPSPGNSSDYGELALIILNPDGTPRLDNRFKRARCNVMDTDPAPMVSSMHVSVEGDWALFTIRGCGTTEEFSGLWAFRLSDGEFLHRQKNHEDRTPAGNSLDYLMPSAVVKGTPWLLCMGIDLKTRSAVLLDPRAGIVWSQTFPVGPYLKGRGPAFPPLLGSDDPGEFRRLVSMKAGWGRDPNYPTDIVAAPNGGFLIRDFNGLHRMVDRAPRRERGFFDPGGRV